MAEYLVLIYGDESAMDDAAPAEMGKMMEGHRQFGQKYAASLRGGNALQASSTATTIRSDGVGGFTITDGVFAETKEALGGYYLIEATDLDEAIAMAKEIPAPNGGVEVRPIRPLD
jgi:hypothetical protein